jgi:hypothetical protein
MVQIKTLIMLIILSILSVACAPSLKETRENYVKAHPNLSQEAKEAILKGEAVIGMTEDDVKASCGTPNIVKPGAGEAKEICDYWGYKRYKVYFDKDGKVIKVR